MNWLWKCKNQQSRVFQYTTFQILFEAYKFEKERQNVEEAAHRLKRLLTHFPNESWSEIENIIEQLQVGRQSLILSSIQTL